MKTRTFVVLSLLSLLAGWGCGDMTPKRRNASGTIGGAGLTGADTATAPAAAPQQQQPQPAAGQIPPAVTTQGAVPSSPGVPAPIPGVPSSAPATPGTVTVPAAPGVTGKGNYGPGIITTPVSVYFRVKEQLIFDQVKYAIKLFEAEKGYKPRSHEEFMKEIIEANQPVLKLPKLPEGHTYKYDPQKGELMVEQPE